MKGKISKIKNTKGELALPITTVEAVYMKDGTTKLSDEIKDVLKYETFDDESVTAEIPSVIEQIDGIKKDIGEINSSLDNIAIIINRSNGENDTEMFQKAIDKINKSEGGRIYIPAGKYFIDTLTINKEVANKIIFMGQAQKTDYWNAQHETVQLHSINGNDMFVINGVTTYFEGISLIGKDKTGFGIKSNKAPRTSLYKSKVYGFNTGIEIKNGIHDIRECEITGNNTGAYLYTSGDSCISDCWINTNGIGVSYNQYCSNSQIKGGKIEWNDRGILLSTGGIIISNIQFDFNKEHDIYLDGTIYGRHYYGVYPDNVFSVNILNNRFLGSGYNKSATADSKEGCFIYCLQCSEILINGNNFTSGGRWAQDNGGLSDNEPLLGIGPNNAFIKCKNSMISVTGNEFNSQYNTPPVMVTDIDKLTSKVLFQANRNLCGREPFIYDFGVIKDLPKKQTVFYCENNRREYKNQSEPVYGTFNKNDVIYNNKTNDKIEDGWECIESGTLKDDTDITVITNVGTNKITLSRDIKPHELEVGDYILFGEEIKRVVRIVYKDSDKPVLSIPDVFVDSNVNTSYHGNLTYYKPRFLPLNFYKKIKKHSFANTSFTLNYNYKILGISSDSADTSVILPDEYIYDGQEFLITCDWIIREVKFKRTDGTVIGTLPASSVGWWKAIYKDGNFKMIQISTTL